jgi:hypothetical protein
MLAAPGRLDTALLRAERGSAPEPTDTMFTPPHRWETGPPAYVRKLAADKRYVRDVY